MKKTATFMLVICLLAACLQINAYSAPRVVNIVVDGQLKGSVSCDTSPKGSTMIPVKEVMEFLGATVYIDEKKKKTTVVYADAVIEMVDGEKAVKINSRELLLREPVYTIKGKPMAVFDIINQCLGADLQWSYNYDCLYITMQPDLQIRFTDPNLESTVRKAVNKPTGAILKREAAKIKDLFAQDSGIRSLEGIQYLFNLEVLILRKNQISDITPISKLPRLTLLYLPDNNIADISSLRTLSKLRQLDLANNQVTDIDALKDLNNLFLVNLRGNEIQDITPLSGKTKLESLNICKTETKDISKLTNLPVLKYLSLDDNEIADITSLKYFKSLISLGLSRNKVRDISTLSDLVNLTSLSLTSNYVSDVTPLEGLTKLDSLILNDNIIDDISALDKLTNITYLNLEGNRIKDINALRDLNKISILRLSDNEIRDIGLLRNMPKLEHLDLGINPLEDISILEDIKGLKEVRVYNTWDSVQYKQVHEKVKSIIKSIINPNMNDYQKVRAIHNYIARNTQYDYKNFLNNTLTVEDGSPYGILIDKKGVCGGYSFTFKLLANAAGVECYYVTGNINTTGGRHAWNIVKIDEGYYHLDVTWADQERGLIYQWFLLSDERMEDNRKWDKEKYPQCISDKYAKSTNE